MVTLGFLLLLGGLFFWPLLPVGLLLVLFGLVINAIKRQGAATRRQMAADVDNRPRRPCPSCAEHILATANLCPFCHQAVEPEPWLKTLLWGPVKGRR